MHLLLLICILTTTILGAAIPPPGAPLVAGVDKGSDNASGCSKSQYECPAMLMLFQHEKYRGRWYYYMDETEFLRRDGSEGKEWMEAPDHDRALTYVTASTTIKVLAT
ncbi:hypothetical protein CC80DRAFT_546038 [Byssothecium circinans]|uniref:Uncharacterized protein n=1 Tax=Byssothecium circinans TaxID=147558 RepID=A0A6A5U231_9PLEO|nr:hypothetical protein CC80DRAFT_546038 [Byssothecium circinans]